LTIPDYEKGYVCSYEGDRFASHLELAQHLIDNHGFKVTTNSHTNRYWRFWYHPYSEEEKLNIKLRILWSEKPDEYITGETTEGAWSHTPNSLYEEWEEAWNKLLGVHNEE